MPTASPDSTARPGAYPRRLRALGGLACALVLAGCSDPKAASKANFQKALAAFFDKNCAMLSSPAISAFPHSFSADPSVDIPRLLPEARLLATLADDGFLTKVASLRESEALFAPPGPQQVLEFDLTDKGRAAFKPAGSLGFGSPAGLCAGHIRVVSVDSYTEPADFAGRRVSRVTFTLRADYDDWTKAPAVQAAFRDQLSHTEPRSMTLPLVLGNEGWLLDPNLPMPG